MLSYLVEEFSVHAKFKCGLNQKLHNVTKNVLLFSLFLYAASLHDSFILIEAAQGHRMAAGGN